MARQYSAKTLLRNTPQELLKAYFDQRRIDIGLDIARYPFIETNPIFAAIEKLPERTRSEIDTDFRAVNELAGTDGTLIIVTEAAAHGIDLSKRFAAMKSGYERALWTFLKMPEIFEIASSFHEMDRRAGWRRRFVGEDLEPQSADASLRAFEKSLLLFYRRQGRGRFCHID